MSIWDMFKPPGDSSGSIPIVTTHTGTTLDPQQLQQMLTQFGEGLTKEEEVELADLIKQHEADIKAAKMNAFKKLPSGLRQFVLDILSWKEANENINSVTVSKPSRLEELESKDLKSQLFGHRGARPFWSNPGYLPVNISDGTSYQSPQFDLAALLPVPEGLIFDDLKQAHLEATLEEEMLGKDVESK